MTNVNYNQSLFSELTLLGAERSQRRAYRPVCFRGKIRIPFPILLMHPLASEPIPLTIVEGFLGGAGAVLWGDFDQYLNLANGKKRRTMFTR